MNDKSNYSGLWLLLSVALSVIMLLAFSDDITIGEWTIKKAPVADLLFPEEGNDGFSDVSLSDIADSLASRESEPVKEVEVDSTAKSILLFGDSMTLNLAVRLSKYARQNGHSFHAVNWDSSNTKIWAECDTLDHFIKEYKADFIFISLGSNEVYFKKPESRLPYIKKILEKIGDTPYVWLGPPNWNEDTGINDILQASCRRGSFFRTQGMELKRKADKIHPTRSASALWIDSVMRWMPKSSHPILAELPSDTIGKVPVNVIFLKALNK